MKAQEIYSINLKQTSPRIIGLIALINMLLAAAAFLKDISLASYMGTTLMADSFMIAFFIPDMIGNNLLGNAIGISCIPSFSRYYIRGEKRKLIVNFIGINLLGFVCSCCLVLILFVFKDVLIGLLGANLTQNTKDLSTTALNIMLPTVVLYPAIFTAIAFLQSTEKFVIASMAPVLYNGLFLLGTILCIQLSTPQMKGVQLISIFVLLAVVAMVCLTYSALMKNKMFSIYEDRISIKEVIEQAYKSTRVYKMVLSYGTILLLGQIILYVERYLASKHGIGSISGLSYAYRLAQFPVWVFVIAIGTVIFPVMSKENEKGEYGALNILAQSLWLVAIITIPISILLFVLREPIISLLFVRGAFTRDSLNITADVLKSYSLTILGQSITIICLRYFLAVEEMKRPIGTLLISTILTLTADHMLIERIGVQGLGYGAFIGGVFSSVIFLYYIGKKMVLVYHSIIDKCVKLLLANGMIFLLASCHLYLWNTFFSGTDRIVGFAYGLMVVVTCTLCYLLSLRYSRMI